MKRLLLALVLCCGLISRVALADCVVAAGGSQRITGTSTTSGSGVLINPANPWVVGDVGKSIWVTFAGGSVIVQTATISAFTNAGQITASANASITVASAIVTWGATGHTAAISSAVTTCTGSVNTNYPSGYVVDAPTAGTVRLSGWYMVTGCIYDVTFSGPTPSIIGDGRYSTGIFMAPSMTPCTGAQLINSRGSGQTFADFTIDGGDSLNSYTGAVISIFSSDHPSVKNLDIRFWGSNQALSRGLGLISNAHMNVSSVTVQGGPPGTQSTAVEIWGNGVVDDLVASNYYRNLLINNAPSRGTAGSSLLMRGGIVDECSDPARLCTIVNDGKELNANGTSFLSTVQIGVGSAFFATNVNLGAYNASPAVPALTVASTGKVTSASSTYRGSGVAKAVTNNGKFVDVGGNVYKSCTLGTDTCVEKTAAQAFVGTLPVVR